MLDSPIVFLESTAKSLAALPMPVVLFPSAPAPMAVFSPPVIVRLPALKPRNRLLVPKV